jgi:4-diphosphocytidyl-2-C-methyl-D-erythritol kinase
LLETETIACRSPAKVNLTLDVVALRPDGYHELRSVVHTIGLWDEIALHFGPGRFDSGEGLSLDCNLPELISENNLCLRAARAFEEAARALGKPTTGSLRIDLRKTIPSGAGLGGGSGNAAAILLALNEYRQGLLSNDALIGMAARLGADVPLFLTGGCLLMEGVGERIAPLRALSGWLVLVKPETHISTAGIFRQWDEMQLGSRHATDAMLFGLEAGNAEVVSVANALHNDLQAVVEARDVPIAETVALLEECGAHGAAMSGSGSAVYGVFSVRENAEEARLRLRRQLPASYWIAVAPLSSRGVELGVVN